MISPARRRALCDKLIGWCVAAGREFTEDELRRPALIVAPHPDDEALACGGTILRMRRLGTEVDIVFVTDGGRSHGPLVEVDELARRRQAEALAAAAVMQVDPGRVHFLGIGDSRLTAHAGTARQQIAAIIAARQPAQVFVSSGHDHHADHLAANAIVHAALSDVAARVPVYEYTVYLWSRWPWCGTSPAGVEYGGPQALLHGSRMTLRFMLRFRRFVRTEAVLADKRRALAAHASQTSEVLPGGPNMQQWSAGEFLGWAFCGYEFFRERLPR